MEIGDRMPDRIKKLKIIPDSPLRFIESVVGLNVPQKIKDFLFECLQTDITDVNPEYDFYIDEPYKFNFYNYSQKQDPRFIIKCFKNGFNVRETNFFTSEPNFRKDDHYLKVKTKRGYDDYYNYIFSEFEEYQEFDDTTLIVETPITDTLDELVFDPKIMDRFKEFLQEMFEKGLWLNNFNNYSIRYDKSLDEMFVYDPDSFYVIAQNKDLKRIQNFDQFMYLFEKYKLKEKSVIYRLKDNELTEEAARYIYYSYWFLENFSQRMK